MKGKYKNRTRVEKGYGPRHALNAQEGSEAVPEELPTPPAQPDTRGGALIGSIANQFKDALVTPEGMQAIRQEPMSLAALQAYLHAGLGAGALVGGEGGEPTNFYHGTAHDFVDFNNDTAFFTPDKKAADLYRQRSIFNQHDVELPEDVYSADELGHSGIQQIADEEGIDLSKGRVLSTPLNLNNTLDLSHLDANFDPANDWDDLHKLGLVEDKWANLEPEAQREVEDEYGGKALWNFLDNELHSTIRSKGYDSVRFNDVDTKGNTHETYGVFDPRTATAPSQRAPTDEQLKFEGYARGTMSVGPRHADNAFQSGTSDTSTTPDASGYNPSGFYGNVLQPQDVEAMRAQMDAPGRSSLSPIEETLAANPDAQSFYFDQTSGNYVPFGGASGYAVGDENIKPGSINDEVPLPVQGNTEMVETPTDTSHSHGLEQLDIPPASETPEVNLDTLGLSPGQMEIINALGYDPSQNQGAGGGGMQLINELGYDPSHAYGSAGSGVPTQTGAGYGGQFVGGLLGNLLLPGIGGLVGSQLGGAGARMLTRSLQGGQVPWQTQSAPQQAQGGDGSGSTDLSGFFPSDLGGLGQPMGYFGIPEQQPLGEGMFSAPPGPTAPEAPGGSFFTDNIGAGPLPGSFAGLGSFGGGDLGSYGGGIGEHTPSFQAWVQGQGFPNVTAYQAAMAPQGPSLGMAAGGGGAPVGLQHATGGHIQTAQGGKSNVHSTDTVPAMLTPREAVLNRNAAELAGRGNIQKLNSEGNQLAEQGVDLAGEDKNMKQKYQRGAARIAPVPLTGPKPTARADLAGIMKYLPMGQLARSAQSQAVMPKVGVRGYQAGTSATDPLSMYQNKLSTSPLGGGQSLGGGPGPSPFPGPSPTPNPGPGPMPVSTTPPPYGGRPVPTLGGAPSVPPRPDAGKDPTGAMSTPLSFNNWAANAGAPGFVTQPVPPTPNPDGTLNATKPGAPPSPSLFPGSQSNSFFPPPNPAQRTPPPLGFQGGTIDAPQAGTQFANVQYSAPQINIAALKNHLQSQGLAPNTVTNLLKTLQGTGALGGGVNTGMTTPGGMSIVNSLGYDPSQPQGYQGGISDIGYPPMVGPNMVYHADKGSNWIGDFDPRYTYRSYWRGTGAVMPMGANLGPVMGARPFVHPVRPVAPIPRFG